MGLIKYDLSGNIIKEKKISDWKYMRIIQDNDGFIFALKTEKESGFSYDGIAIVSKFTSDFNEIWNKNLHRENGNNYVRYFLANYKNGLLLTVSQSDKQNLQTWMKFFEFDKNGNKLDENIVTGYPKSTTLYFAGDMHYGGVLVSGGTLYDQYSPPVLVNGDLMKFSYDVVTNAIFIKISPDVPLGDQKIRKFDEEFLRK